MKHNKFTTRTELKSLRMSIECARMECGSLRMFIVCLVDSSMCLAVPFIAPRQLGAVESNSGRQFLPSVASRTTRHCPVQISFLIWRSRPLAPGSRWRTGHCPVHTGQSDAPHRPLELPRVAHRFHGRPLALATVGSPDSPVHHRTVR